MSTITPVLFDTKSSYQLIVSITKCEKLFKSVVEERLSKSNCPIRPVRLQLFVIGQVESDRSNRTVWTSNSQLRRLERVLRRGEIGSK